MYVFPDCPVDLSSPLSSPFRSVRIPFADGYTSLGAEREAKLARAEMVLCGGSQTTGRAVVVRPFPERGGARLSPQPFLESSSHERESRRYSPSIRG